MATVSPSAYKASVSTRNHDLLGLFGQVDDVKRMHLLVLGYIYENKTHKPCLPYILSSPSGMSHRECARSNGAKHGMGHKMGTTMHRVYWIVSMINTCPIIRSLHCTSRLVFGQRCARVHATIPIDSNHRSIRVLSVQRTQKTCNN